MSDSQTKQPNESRLYDMDFTNLLGSTEVITAINSSVQEEWDENTDAYITSTDLTLSSQAFSGKLAQVRIAGGIDGKSYRVTLIVATDATNILEGEGILVVVNL